MKSKQAKKNFQIADFRINKVVPPFLKIRENPPTFPLACTRFSVFLCMTHVRRPSEAFTCIFTAQPWRRGLKQACDVSFTLRRLVFCFAEELKMLPVAMDTFLHWSCCRCYQLTLIINVPRVIVVFLFTEPVAKLAAVESPSDDHFGSFSGESRPPPHHPPPPFPGSIVTCTDGHVGSKTPRWCRPSR